jgi:protoporphyrinogen oxidase
MDEKSCVELAVKELKSMGVISADAKVLDSHREKVQKAYPAYFDTYDRIDELVSYLDTFENLYCVGRNGQHRYNNMDHSMVTSFEAVSNIISGKKTKENIWSVNTEAEYHEENSNENSKKD